MRYLAAYLLLSLNGTEPTADELDPFRTEYSFNFVLFAEDTTINKRI